MKVFDKSLPEQVIEVPKIGSPHRAALRKPQLAEQLVEVPMTPGYALAFVAVQILGWRAAQALLSSSTPLGHGGTQILAAATVADAVVDVSVTTQLRSSSPSSCPWMCLRFRSSTELWVFQLLHRDRYAQCKLCRRPEIRQVQFLDRLDMPVVVQRQCLDGRTQFSLEVPAGAVPVVLDAFGGSEGVFGAFCVIFRAPPVVRS